MNVAHASNLRPPTSNLQPAYSISELMIAAGASELHDGELVVAGLGIPQIAALLAQRTGAPNLRLLNEIGVIDARPARLGVGNADARHWHDAAAFGSFIDVMGAILHRGLVDVGFLGALEVDVYGNINATHVVRPDGSIRLFGGTGGGTDLAALARRIIVIIRHDRLKLVERVTHNTSPGFIGPGNRRGEVGLRGGGPSRVITDKAVFGFDKETHRLKLLSIHPGVSHDELLADTGFPLEFPGDCAATPEPTAEQLRLIREDLDPDRQYTSA